MEEYKCLSNWWMGRKCDLFLLKRYQSAIHIHKRKKSWHILPNEWTLRKPQSEARSKIQNNTCNSKFTRYMELVYSHQEEADLWVPGDKEKGKWEWLLKKNGVSVKGNKVFHGRVQQTVSLSSHCLNDKVYDYYTIVKM